MNQTTEGIARTPRQGALRALRSSRDASTRPRGVLVIDDNEAVRTVLDVALRASGYTVWLMPGGRAGVVAFLRYRPAIDIVLLDVQMPDWDGPETLAAIRALDPDVPCYFMSGDMGHYSEESLLDLGAVAVLRKPFILDDLLAQFGRIA